MRCKQWWIWIKRKFGKYILRGRLWPISDCFLKSLSLTKVLLMAINDNTMTFATSQGETVYFVLVYICPGKRAIQKIELYYCAQTYLVGSHWNRPCALRFQWLPTRYDLVREKKKTNQTLSSQFSPDLVLCVVKVHWVIALHFPTIVNTLFRQFSDQTEDLVLWRSIIRTSCI